ncbi:MAG: hypothetical protein L6Q76_04650 [Polyangiaceae bacterium]|nr:hypothetical protein [Polyangiaceae bacterium]
MAGQGERAGGYAVPTYRAPEDTAWYHFLHGNVPGHQIDFMYRPELPQGLLTRQHFSHLERLIKYIEPHTNNPYAFAIGNLSRDDTQYEPGHGGLGMIFGFRIEGVTDHAGRQDPPFAHGIATVDRNLDAGVIFEAARSFYNHLFSKSGFENPSTVLYQEYVRFATKNPSVLSTVLKAYVEDFSDLPVPESSSLASKWLANEAAQPKRVVVVHPNDAPFRVIAQCAARIAAMLYQSNIKWSAITNGRESDLPGGVTVRLVAKRDRSAYESDGLVLRLDEVPEDEEGIAEQLFSARRVAQASEAAPVQGWRARMQAQAASALISTPPPPMPGAGEEGVAGRYGSPDLSERTGQPGGGGSSLDADGAVPAPSSKRAGDRAARPWMSNPRELSAGDVELPSRDATSASALNPTDGASAKRLDPLPSETSVPLTTEKRAEALRPDSVSAEADAALDRPSSRRWLWLGFGLLVATSVPIAIWAASHSETEPASSSGADTPTGISSATTSLTNAAPPPTATATAREAAPVEIKNNEIPSKVPSTSTAVPAIDTAPTAPPKQPKGSQASTAGQGAPPKSPPPTSTPREPRPGPSSTGKPSAAERPPEF